MKLFFSTSKEDPEASSPVLSILDRLWQTKIQSIALIDFWSGKSKDADIRSGLHMQLEDERRHLRLIGEEIRRLGGRVSSERREGPVARAFGLIRSQATDLRRLCCYYRGVKLTTHSRTSQLVQIVEPATAGLMSQIARDEERHIRWADIRISHQMTVGEMRECNSLMDRMDTMVDASWQKLWLEIVRTKMGRRTAS
jgi:hypothetical protein